MATKPAFVCAQPHQFIIPISFRNIGRIEQTITDLSPRGNYDNQRPYTQCNA
jgi:hypothetical protein